ncbi:MAG: response regulator transcription factor [Ndongobacter sp.]|nr:response regulator transcription factor [Ndongobacter sp.]
MRILIVHSEDGLVSDLQYSLENDGNEIVTCRTVTRALERVRQMPPSFCLIGTSFSDGSGLDLLRALREEADVPTIVLSEDVNEKQVVLALEYGCDDYVGLPLNMLELKARMRAVLRRMQKKGESAADASDFFWEQGNLSFDLLRRSVRYKGVFIPLAEKEWAILWYLAYRSGETVSREELNERIWTEPAEGNLRTVDVHIRRLRQKLAAYHLDRCIQTRRGEGYLYRSVEPIFFEEAQGAES